jgi:hypothetical protein
MAIILFVVNLQKMKRSSRTYYQLIFTFGVMVFLLRPFVGYLMIGAGGATADPLRTSLLMQRLIKKKEEHHEPEAEAIQEPGRSQYARPLPVRLTRYLHSLFFSLYSSIRFFAVSIFTTCLFMIVPDNHWYRSHSLFRI